MNTIEINSIASESYYVSEAFKSLRTNLQFCGADIQCVMITSCLPNEGKSIISIELSKSLSELGKKVLMIDADMRKSIMTSRYQINFEVKGLSQYLSGQASIDDVIYATQYPGLYAILSGVFPPNPVELLYGNKFSDLIKEMRKRFDYIIIDTPPLGCVTDAAVISPLCDGAVLVFAPEKVSARLAISVREQLEKANCKILGAIINHVEQKKSPLGKRYGEYRYKSGYYASDTDNDNVPTENVPAATEKAAPATENAAKTPKPSSVSKASKEPAPSVTPLMATKKPYQKRKGPESEK